MDNLHQYLVRNKIKHAILNEYLVEIPKLGVILLLNGDKVIVNNTPQLNPTQQQLLPHADFYAFKLTELSNYFYAPINNIWDISELKYVGEPIEDDQIPPSLGIHGNYETGVSEIYDNYIKKTTFFNNTQDSVLGISEFHGVDGCIVFQKKCLESNITPIIGVTLSIAHNKSLFSVKLYVENTQGWENVIFLTNYSSIRDKSPIPYEVFLQHLQGVVIVYGHEVVTLLDKGEQIPSGFFQFDITELSSLESDTEKLLNLKKYFDNYQKELPHVFIQDTYYCDEEGWKIRDIYNKMLRSGFYEHSKTQYLKSISELYIELSQFFKDYDKLGEFYCEGILNLNTIVDKCREFRIETGVLKLPKYKLTKEEEERYGNSTSMLYGLIEEGLVKKNIPQEKLDEYLSRVQEELSVILEGGFEDYFLILYDIIKYAESNGIIVGVGRGSAGGSLVAYLLDIVKINPLEYGLLFERFLNKARIKSSAPDIDVDFQGTKRGQIKEYIEKKYGKEFVASIGTFTRLQNKGILQELCRVFNVPPQVANYFSKFISNDWSYGELLAQLNNMPRSKKFLHENANLFRLFPYFKDLIKSSSIHAAGVVIVPESLKGVQYSCPIRIEDGQYVTQWEGSILEDIGMLKEDILGISQLDKFKDIFNLIKENRGQDLHYSDIELNDNTVMEYFRRGWNEDVFQFGASGLKGYCIQLQPQDINDLIATVALYRPGTMESGTHLQYIKLRNGEEHVSYIHPLMEIVTSETYGLLIYQEQIMKTLQVLANFSLQEADSVRKGIGKMIPEVVKKSRDKFIQGCVDNNISHTIAEEIWIQLERFASYGFNKSHAASYAITGYYCQWLKVHYPLEFWATSLKYANDVQILKRIVEIHKVGSIKLLPPDINHSSLDFVINSKDNSIIWSLPSIKGITDKSVLKILQERESGQFTSLEDFITRMKGSRITVLQIQNLILSGCFDQVERVTSPIDRSRVIEKLRNLTTWDKDILSNITSKFDFILLQRELCGFGNIDSTEYYNYINKNNTLPKLVDVSLFFSELENPVEGAVVGVVVDIKESNSKNGKFATITIEYEGELVSIIIWSEIWSQHRSSLINSEKKILCITGTIKFDNWRKQNVLQTNRKTQIII